MLNHAAGRIEGLNWVWGVCCLTAILWAGGASHAATIASYDMAGNPTTTGDPNDATPQTYLTVSNLTDGNPASTSMLEGNNTWVTYGPGSSVDGQTWWSRMSIISNPANSVDYVEFTLTPTAGRQVSIDSLSARLGAASNGITGTKAWQLNVYTSLDGFATAGTLWGSLAHSGPSAGGASITYEMPAALTALGTFGQPVTFRLFLQDNSGSSAANKYPVIDTLTVEGAVFVPEPSSGLLALIGMIGLARLRRRCRPLLRAVPVLAAAVVLVVGLSATASQAAVVASEDFEALTSSSFPGTDIDGQGGWVTTADPLSIRNDAAAFGSSNPNFTGNVAYRQGNAYRNDGGYIASLGSVTPNNKVVTLEFAARVGSSGSGYQSKVGVGYFDGSDFYIGFLVGAGDNDFTAFIGTAAAEGLTSVGTSSDGMPSASTIADFRFTLDLGTETGTLEVNTGSGFFTPSGMSGLDFSALGSTGSNGLNVLNWNSLYIRGANGGDAYDNISLAMTVPEPSTGLLVLALVGFAARRRRK